VNANRAAADGHGGGSGDRCRALAAKQAVLLREDPALLRKLAFSLLDCGLTLREPRIQGGARGRLRCGQTRFGEAGAELLLSCRRGAGDALRWGRVQPRSRAGLRARGIRPWLLNELETDRFDTLTVGRFDTLTAGRFDELTAGLDTIRMDRVVELRPWAHRRGTHCCRRA
jgi:hypothetical protein